MSQKLNSGDESCPAFDTACQNGVACVLAMAEKARPMIPDTVPSSRSVVSFVTVTGIIRSKSDVEKYRNGDETYRTSVKVL